MTPETEKRVWHLIYLVAMGNTEQTELERKASELIEEKYEDEQVQQVHG